MKNLKTLFSPHYRKLTRWELSLICGVLVALLSGIWLSAEQDQLAEGMIRLHVVANSNSAYDQKLKLDVRDQVLQLAEQLYEEGCSPEDAEAVFQAHLSDLAWAGQSVAGDFKVEAKLAQVWFPTKTYQDFALPSGEYTALQVTIGEGTGENWWCVAYPPLCLGAASQTVDQAVEAGNFSPEEKSLITGEGYVLKFKSIELLENMKAYFS